MSYLKPKKWVRPSLLWRERPRGNSDYIRFSLTTGVFEAFIRKDVLETAYQVALEALPNETMGLLAGRVCQDAQGRYTLVHAAEGANSDEVYSTPNRVRISAKDYATVRQRLERAHPALEMVGWFHSHPTLQPQFSLEDMREQSTWTDINHVALVVSCGSVAERFGLYCGPDSTEMFRQNN
jgi:proteasome lid subunit RPN8/RPN11